MKYLALGLLASVWSAQGATTERALEAARGPLRLIGERDGNHHSWAAAWPYNNFSRGTPPRSVEVPDEYIRIHSVARQ